MPIGNLPVTCNFDKCADTSARVVRSTHPRAQRHWCLAVFGFVIVGGVEDALANDPGVVDARVGCESALFRPVDAVQLRGPGASGDSIESTRAVVSGVFWTQGPPDHVVGKR